MGTRALWLGVVPVLLAGCHRIFPFDVVLPEARADAAHDVVVADIVGPEGPVDAAVPIDIEVIVNDVTVVDTLAPDSGPGGSYVWSMRLGDTSAEFAYGLAVDPVGNSALTGYFTGTTNLGGGNLSSDGNEDIFVASYDAGGQHRWSVRFGGPGTDKGLAAAADSAGNVYVVGHFDSTVSFGGQTLASKGGDDIFVASFDSLGNHRWSSSFGSSDVDQATGVAVDPGGNVTVTGTFTGAVAFGGALAVPKGGLDIFVAGYSSGGVYRWSTTAGGGKTDRGLAVAADASGNVYVTGDFNETIAFGSNTLASMGAEDIFLASFGSLGQHRWSKAFGGLSVDQGLGVAAGGGQVYATGHFKTTVAFDETTASHVTQGGSDVFLAAFDEAGAYQWSKTFGSPFADYGYGAAAGAQGNVAITGYISAAADFGGGPLPFVGIHDIFVASYTAGGQHRFSKGYGDTQSDHGRAVAFDPAGPLLATGYFMGKANFGGGPELAKGSWDAFLIKLTP